MTQEASMIEKIKVILKGIDQTEIESEDGWWETSTGAKLGAEALKQILELLAQPEQDEDAIIIQYHEATIKRLEKRIEELLAQTQEPVQARTVHITWNADGIRTVNGVPDYTTPPQRTEQDPRCMKMNDCKTKCEDCPDEPPQRTWVDLTDEEIDALHTSIKVRLIGTFDTKDIYRVVEQALKEKNT